MLNTFTTFANIANALSTDKQALEVLKGDVTYNGNALAYSALHIKASGTQEDNDKLTASIAKDAIFNHHKKYVSFATKVIGYFQDNQVVKVNGQELTLEDILATNDGLPYPVALSSIYAEVNKATNTETEANKHQRAVNKQAKALASQEKGVELTTKQFDSLSNKLTYVVQAEAMLAENKVIESKQEALSRILNDIQTLGLWDDVRAAMVAIEAQPFQNVA